MSEKVDLEPATENSEENIQEHNTGEEVEQSKQEEMEEQGQKEKQKQEEQAQKEEQKQEEQGQEKVQEQGQIQEQEQKQELGQEEEDKKEDKNEDEKEDEEDDKDDKDEEEDKEEEDKEEQEQEQKQHHQEEKEPKKLNVNRNFSVEKKQIIPEFTLEGKPILNVSEEVFETPANDSSTKFEEELEQEVRYRDTVLWSVRVLEQSVDELEAQLENLENGEDDEENEFKLRCEAQTDLNQKLEEQIKWYNQEVMKIKERIKRGNEFSYDADLEEMTEFELAKLVKQLERERNNLYGDLRNKSWFLDNQSKEYYHYKELIKAYTGDLNHINRSLEQIWRQRSKSRESGIFSGMTPVTSPGSLNWSSGESGIRPSHRILDPRKGPVRKTAGVRSLPRLDQKALEEYDALESGKKKRTRSMSHAPTRTKSLEVKRGGGSKKNARVGHRSADELDRSTIENSAATSVEPASDPSEDLTIESFPSSVN